MEPFLAFCAVTVALPLVMLAAPAIATGLTALAAFCPASAAPPADATPDTPVVVAAAAAAAAPAIPQTLDAAPPSHAE